MLEEKLSFYLLQETQMPHKSLSRPHAASERGKYTTEHEHFELLLCNVIINFLQSGPWFLRREC